MGFGGSVAAMIATIKNNKRNRVSTFKKIKELKKSKKSELHFEKKANPIELKKIRDKIQKENELVFRKKIIIVTLLLLAVLGFLVFSDTSI